MKFSVGLIGVGFVGGALFKSFEGRGQEVFVYDKYKKLGKPEDVLRTSMLFLCLPTNLIEGHGYDLSAIQETCKYLSDKRYTGLVVLKSTLEPGTTAKLSERYNLNICHNPEFLTARTADEDFDNQSHIVLGSYRLMNNVNLSNERIPYVSVDILEALYRKLYPDAAISLCTAAESEMMKIGVNSFYAIKIMAFNEIQLLCQKLNLDFETVRRIMLGNDWINPMHTKVGSQSPDGKYGYGGACLPKDSAALSLLMKKEGCLNAVIEATVKENKKIREN